MAIGILSWNIRWGCGCDDRVDFDRIAAFAVDAQSRASDHPPIALTLV